MNPIVLAELPVRKARIRTKHVERAVQKLKKKKGTSWGSVFIAMEVLSLAASGFAWFPQKEVDFARRDKEAGNAGNRLYHFKQRNKP